MTEREDTSTEVSRAAVPATTRSRPRLWIGAVVVIGVLVLIFVLTHRHRAGGSYAAWGSSSSSDEPVAVSVATVGTGDIEVKLAAIGTITPLATVTVKTQIAGQLQHIAFTEGQLVHAGEFLAQVDPRPYQAVLEQNRGNLRRDEALLADAKLDLARYKDLIKDDAVSAQQLDQQKATVEQYEGTVEADKAQVDAAAVNLG
ncbi:MAG TPA: efflux RND transporter periplasmic adaptor subunit, partial [Steroidobacteraceae bacterium]|nr:efflux RND transporter periplasmic adaptor subunit [Steroidobacteraceae bacterium]